MSARTLTEAHRAYLAWKARIAGETREILESGGTVVDALEKTTAESPSWDEIINRNVGMALEGDTDAARTVLEEFYRKSATGEPANPAVTGYVAAAIRKIIDGEPDWRGMVEFVNSQGWTKADIQKLASLSIQSYEDCTKDCKDPECLRRATPERLAEHAWKHYRHELPEKCSLPRLVEYWKLKEYKPVEPLKALGLSKGKGRPKNDNQFSRNLRLFKAVYEKRKQGMSFEDAVIQTSSETHCSQSTVKRAWSYFSPLFDS